MVQLADTIDLKSIKCGFDSHLEHMAKQPKIVIERKKIESGGFHPLIKIKWLYQKLVRGYSDKDIVRFSDFAKLSISKRSFRNLGSALQDFITLATEWGKYLPPEYETNPAEWLNVLRDIEKIFNKYEPKEVREKGVYLFLKYIDYLHD